MIIYVAKKDNEIVYIGQTRMPLSFRKGKHLSEARKGRGSIFGAAIRKHGEMKFIFEILDKAIDQDDLNKKEKYYISFYNPKYNLQEGGQKSFIPWNKGKKELREDVRKNISLSAKTRKRTPRGNYSLEHKDKIGQATLNRSAKPFKCVENGKVYQNKVTAAKDLNIDARGISILLMEKTRLKSYKGYTFEYLAQDKPELIKLKALAKVTDCKGKASSND